MEENTTTNNTPEAKSNNSMLLIIGAVVLAAILGYAIFSSANNEAESPVGDTRVEDTDQEMMIEDEEDAMTENGNVSQEDSDSMMEGNMEGSIETDTLEAMEMEEAANVKEFTIDGANYSYTPNNLTVNEGDTVRITLNSTDMMHDFVIDELDVKSDVIPNGESTTIEFVADQSGTFEFYCSVGDHRERGMVGTLTVQ